MLTVQNGALKAEVSHSIPLDFINKELLRRKGDSIYLTLNGTGLYSVFFDSFPNVRVEPVKAAMYDVAGGTGKKVNDYRFITMDASNDNIYIWYSGRLVQIDGGGIAITICEDCIRSLVYGPNTSVDKTGKIWAGANGGAMQIDTRTGKCEEFSPWDVNQRNASHHVFTLYKDRSEVLWLGSNGYGLLK